MVPGRRVALDHHGHGELFGRVFDGRDEVQVIFQPGNRRHEDVHAAFAGFHAERRADGLRRGLGDERLGDGLGGFAQRRARDASPASRACVAGAMPGTCLSVVASERRGSQRHAGRDCSGATVGDNGPWPAGRAKPFPFASPQAREGSGPRRGQRIALLPGIAVVAGVPGQAVQRQPQAHRRIAGQEEHVLLPQQPAAAFPARGHAVAVDRANRQGVAHDLAQTAFEDPCQAFPLFLVLQVRLQRVDVDRQAAALSRGSTRCLRSPARRDRGQTCEPFGQVHDEG